jgi:hypothetical protein
MLDLVGLARLMNELLEGNSEHARTFAFTPAELTVVKMIAIIGRTSAARSGEPADPACTPEAVLQNALEPFAMSPGKWRKKIVAILEDKSISHCSNRF